MVSMKGEKGKKYTMSNYHCNEQRSLVTSHFKILKFNLCAEAPLDFLS